MTAEREAVRIPFSEEYLLASPSTGGEYRILVAWPDTDPPADGFPSIWLLDGNALFGTVVDAVRMRSRRPDVTGVPPAIVIGIGSPDPTGSDRMRRTLDFTPFPPAGDAGALPGPPTGGAEAFLSFLESGLRPSIEARLPVSPGRRALFGHSLGGLFALHVMATGQADFRAYVASSPSIWWSRDRLLASLSAAATHPSPGINAPRVMITVGEYEEELGPDEREAPGAESKAARRMDRRMVTDARTAAARLQPIIERGGAVHLEIFPGEDHASTTLRTISRCLRFALGE